MAEGLKRIKKMIGKLTGKMDQYHEAISFAERGQQEHARQLFQETEIEERPGKLLVMGKESIFTREVVEYALEMAQRMSYEIIALNTAPLSCDTFKIFSSSQKKLCQDFQSLAEENVKGFLEEAKRMGIPFTHVVKFTEPDDALDEMKKEYTDVEFVVSEAEEEMIANRAEEGERPRKEIFVYSMV